MCVCGGGGGGGRESNVCVRERKGKREGHCFMQDFMMGGEHLR